jgi:hypothetical protein
VDEFANRIRNLLPGKGLAMDFDRDVRAVFDSPEITQILCSPKTVSQAKSVSSKTEKANKKKIQSDLSQSKAVSPAMTVKNTVEFE